MRLGGTPRRAGPRAGSEFRPITWVDPAGNNDYNGLSVRFEHRFSKGPVFPEFVHLGEGHGRFRTGAGILLQPTPAPIRRTLQSGRSTARPASTSSSSTSAAWFTIFPSARAASMEANLNPVLDGSARRLAAQRRSIPPILARRSTCTTRPRRTMSPGCERRISRQKPSCGPMSPASLPARARRRAC
jgi:hypothetical protein